VQLPAPEFLSNFPAWQEWLFRRERTQRLKLQAAQHQQAFCKRYLFQYWRFFMHRNKRMRLAWLFAHRNHERLLKWSSLLAFRVNLRDAKRRRVMQRQVLRHWVAAVRNTHTHSSLQLSHLLVRVEV